MEFDGIRLGFLGGADGKAGSPAAIDETAYEGFVSGAKGRIEIMLTHDGPHGLGTGFHGQVQGSPRITRLVETISPRHLVFGHYHEWREPIKIGPTLCTGLAAPVPPIRRDPSQRMCPAGLAVLRTDDLRLEVLDCEWLRELDNGMDYREEFLQGGRRRH